MKDRRLAAVMLPMAPGVGGLGSKKRGRWAILLCYDGFNRNAKPITIAPLFRSGRPLGYENKSGEWMIMNHLPKGL